MIDTHIILHIDFDYFYAQVEEIARGIHNKPVVVCMFSGRTETSGAVATANYVARRYGVRAGIPIFQAKAKLKETDALFLPADHALYAERSTAIMEALAKYADGFEPASIDEAFLEVSRRCKNYEEAEMLAKKIKKEIFAGFGLTCSVGIGPNKLIAKIASDFHKPDGLTVVLPDGVRAFLDPLDVKEIPGIGPKTNEFLESKGIRKIEDLRNADRGWLMETFGKKTGTWLVAAAEGKDETPVGVFHAQKQISRIKTLKRDTRDVQEIMEALKGLIGEIAHEIREEDLLFGAVGINAIDAQLQMHTKSRSLSHSSDTEEDIRRIAQELFAKLVEQTEVEFRRVGIRVERFHSKKGQKMLGEF